MTLGRPLVRVGFAGCLGAGRYGRPHGRVRGAGPVALPAQCGHVAAAEFVLYCLESLADAPRYRVAFFGRDGSAEDVAHSRPRYPLNIVETGSINFCVSRNLPGRLFWWHLLPPFRWVQRYASASPSTTFSAAVHRFDRAARHEARRPVHAWAGDRSPRVHVVTV